MTRFDVGAPWHDVGMVAARTSTVMVGRDRELSRLCEVFASALDGDPRTVLLSGEAGIGKSRMMRELREGIERRANVLSGQCINMGETPIPYGPLISILRELVHGMGADAALDAAGPGRDALLLLLPELGDGPVDWDEVSSSRLHDVVATLIETYAAKAPLVLLIEDLHWADGSTLTMLRFLMRAICTARLMIVATCRPEDARRGSRVREFIVESERARLIERIDLRRLTRDEVRDLMSSLHDGEIDEGRLDSVFERTEGIPFFVEELSNCSTGPMPDTLRDLLLARYDVLDENAQRILRALSAAEDWTPHSVLRAAVDGTDDALDTGLRAAITADILTVRAEAYCFRHALLREAVHDEMLPGERSRVHLAFAQALEAQAELESRSAIAYHLLGAHEYARALTASVDAMEQAKRSYAYATAGRLGELAIDLWDRVEDADERAGLSRVKLLARVASIHRNAGAGERAIALVRAALDEAERSPVEPSVFVRLLRDKALYLANLGRDGSIPLLIDALALMGDAEDEHPGHVHDEKLRATLLYLLGGRYMLRGDSHEAIVTADAAFQVGTAAGADAEVSIAANLRGMSRAALGHIDEALADIEIARASAVEPSPQLRFHVNYSDFLNLMGQYQEALDVARAGHARATELGVERSSGSILLHNMVDPLLGLGDIDEAERVIERALALGSLTVPASYTQRTKIHALLWRGDVETAKRRAEEWLPGFVVTAKVEHQVWYGLIDITVALAATARDWWGAWRELRDALTEDTERGHVLQQRRLLLDGAAIVARLHVLNASDRAADAAQFVRQRWDSLPEAVRVEAMSHVVWGLTTPPVASAVDEVRAAVAASSDPVISAVLRPLVRLHLARALVDAGDRPGARLVVTEAQTVASDLAYVPLQNEIAEFGRSAGLSVTGQVTATQDAENVDDVDMLTTRERQVLELVAEGLSNRQIGERLFISAKTASVHVSAILRKLGVATRTEAAVLAQRQPQGVESHVVRHDEQPR